MTEDKEYSEYADSLIPDDSAKNLSEILEEDARRYQRAFRELKKAVV